MMRYLVPYFATGLTILVMDIIWLRTLGAAIFRPQVGEILKENPNLLAAGLFYLLYVAGLVYFAILPALKDGGLALAVVNGALIGFLAYMTFDLTTLALIKGWTVKVAIVDITWGTFVSAFSAAVGYKAATTFLVPQ
jgi:uncharacterized membrane protein